MHNLLKSSVVSQFEIGLAIKMPRIARGYFYAVMQLAVAALHGGPWWGLRRGSLSREPQAETT